MATELEKARARIIAAFPALAQGPFEVTSDPDDDYNCFAWAIEDPDHFWWPDAHWPTKRTWSRQSFITAFATKGFRTCQTGDPEPGYVKIALYFLNGKPVHVARLLPDGNWTSKLGRQHDIMHGLSGLNGAEYGEPKLFLKRKCAEPDE